MVHKGRRGSSVPASTALQMPQVRARISGVRVRGSHAQRSWRVGTVSTLPEVNGTKLLTMCEGTNICNGLCGDVLPLGPVEVAGNIASDLPSSPSHRLLRDVRIDGSGNRLDHKSVRRARTLPFHPVVCKDKENIPFNVPEESATSDIKSGKTRLTDLGSDTDSQDSGYSGMLIEKDGKSQPTSFVEPFGIPPRKHKSKEIESPLKGSKSPSSWSSSSSFISQSSGPSVRSSVFTDDDTEDGFMDVFEMDKLDEESNIPTSLTSLLTKPLVKLDSAQIDTNTILLRCEDKKGRLPIRRCLSMVVDDQPSNEISTKSVIRALSYPQSKDLFSDKLRNCLFTNVENTVSSPESHRTCPPADGNNNNENDMEVDHHSRFAQRSSSFKRPDPPKDSNSPIQNKRRKSVPIVTHASESHLTITKKPILQRCYSESEAIMRAVQKSLSLPYQPKLHVRGSEEEGITRIGRVHLKSLPFWAADQQPDLIGDFSKPYILPLIKGRHQDLKTITSQTMMHLLNGKYSEHVKNYIVIDCRYPYEYEAGHIQGAKNIYTKEDILQALLCDKHNPLERNQRGVVVFHCEFSSERAPNLCRFLRNKDREFNKDSYPLLHHPEIYLLDGGYKAFFENFKEFCEPQDYKPMLHKDHEFDLRHFRAKSKSWNGDCKSRVTLRPGLKF